MAGFSDYLEAAVLNHLFRTTALTQPTNVYFALHDGSPGDTGANELAATGSYARVAVARGNSSFSAPANASGAQEITNANAITFPSPSGDWGVVTDFSVWDASSGGNCLGSGALGTSRNILNGDGAPSFAAGTLAIRLGET